MNKYAIIFSAENRVIKDTFDSNGSAPNEKMAIGLAYSIRQFHQDIDVYCGCFTQNTLSKYTQDWFKKLNVTYIEDPVFNTDSTVSCFLRTYCKDYFAERLLDQYDYLIYVDWDVVQLAPITFNFNPMSPLVIVDTMPQWVLNYHKEFLPNLKTQLYYNWIDIINPYNRHLFSMDWTDPAIINYHNSDVLLSNRIADSQLQIIEQDIGSYNVSKPLTDRTLFHHYDTLGPDGSFYKIKELYPELYQKYFLFFEKVLNIKVQNQPGYWEDVAKEHE